MAQHNSGTYNNQYMILDTKLFTPLNGKACTAFFPPSLCPWPFLLIYILISFVSFPSLLLCSTSSSTASPFLLSSSSCCCVPAALPPNTLFVVEQIPGQVAGGDVTDQLVEGFWPSYNVPYHKDIYVASGEV